MSWFDLPKEMRLMILSRTNLVRHRDFEWDSRSGVGANILDGRLMTPQPESEDEKEESDRAIGEMDSTRGLLTRSKAIRKKLPFPFALLFVSRRMHDEALHVFFSENRFVLKGDPKDSYRFLYDLADSAVSQIRALDLELSTRQIIYGFGAGDDWQQWHRLIELIAQRFALDRLWLSIDAGCTKRDLPPVQIRGNDRRSSQMSSYPIIFGSVHQLRGLQRFHVFLKADEAYEDSVEKEVMGPTYNSAVDGKLPYHLRSSCSPHLEIPKSLRDDVDLLVTNPQKMQPVQSTPHLVSSSALIP